MRRGYLVVALIGGALLSAAVAVAAVPVKIVRIVDKRVYTAPGAPKPPFENPSATRRGLTVTIHVSGPLANGAASYGRLAVTQAVANHGGALKVVSTKPLGFSTSVSPGMYKISHQAFGGPPPKGFNVSLTLSNPPRRATMITALRGHFVMVAGGARHVVELVPVASGRPVKNAILAAAKLHLIFLKKGASGTSLKLKITGDQNSLAHVSVVNAAGQPISTFVSTLQIHGGIVREFQLRRAIKAGDRVRLLVYTGLKQISVPFNFRNVRLP